jgi:hypothetical protein
MQRIRALRAISFERPNARPRAVPGASAERRRALMRAVYLPTHSACLRDLTAIHRTLVSMEREAFKSTPPLRTSRTRSCRFSQ